MSDFIIIAMLSVIIIPILAFNAPDVIIYLSLAILITGLVIMIIVGAIQFANDPAGFLWSLLVNNPISVFTSQAVNATPIICPNGSALHMQVVNVSSECVP